MAKLKIALALSLLLLVFVFIALFLHRNKSYKCEWDTFSRAAVAADSETCSVIGRDILRQGGSAVDAAIAALLCTSVINPQSAGIGGGSIFTVMDSSGNVTVINSRETVPSNVTFDLLDTYSKPCKEAKGSKWIGVPGELRGYEKAHKLYGKLPWADLFQPTIKLAREGIKIPDVLGSSIPSIKNKTTNKNPTDKDTTDTMTLWELFSNEEGNLLRTGDVVKFEKLADTLEMIANNGADSFYTGKIAEDLVSDVQKAGGILTLQDLANYNAIVTDALTVPFGEYQMYIPPPPAGGVLLGLVLNILKGFQINSAPQSFDEKTRFYHLYAEAFKFANRLKKHIRDPNIESGSIEKYFTNDSFASWIQAKIKPNKTLDSREYDIPQNLASSSSTDGKSRKSPIFGSTSHVSVLAEDGSAVSVTSSINHVFGSQIYSPQTGVILNNQLADFCERVKKISSGERPPSSMAPSVLKSKSSLLVIGASGGEFITTGLASALINHVLFKKSLKEAIDIPALYVDSEDKLMFEPKWDKIMNQFLMGWGHGLSRFYNVVNAAEKDGDCISAVSDERKMGKAAGY